MSTARIAAHVRRCPRACLAVLVTAALLVSCSDGGLPNGDDDGATTAPWFGTATMGTITGATLNATEINVLLGYTGDITELEITVAGPNALGLERTLTEPNPLVRFVFIEGVQDLLPSGEYQIRVVGDGADRSWLIVFDADVTLNAPSVEVTAAGASAVTLGWEPVAGALSYTALLRPTADLTEVVEGSRRETTDPLAESIVLDDLALDAGAEYVAYVFAYDDTAPSDPTLTPRQVNASFGLTPPFSPNAD